MPVSANRRIRMSRLAGRTPRASRRPRHPVQTAGWSRKRSCPGSANSLAPTSSSSAAEASRWGRARFAEELPREKLLHSWFKNTGSLGCFGSYYDDRGSSSELRTGLIKVLFNNFCGTETVGAEEGG